MLQYKVMEVGAGLCTSTLRAAPLEKCIKEMASEGWKFEKMNTVIGRFLLFWQRIKMIVIFSKEVGDSPAEV